MRFNPNWHVWVKNEKWILPIVLTLWIHFWRSLTYVMKYILTQMKQPVKIFFFSLPILFASLLSHPHTAGQSWCDVCVKVGLAVSKSYRNAWRQPPQPDVGRCGWEFPKLFARPTSSSDEACWQLQALSAWKTPTSFKLHLKFVS